LSKYLRIIYMWFWPKDLESQILDYQTQQYKLFPVIAASLVYKVAARWLWDKYATVKSELERGDLVQLPELNTKAYFT